MFSPLSLLRETYSTLSPEARREADSMSAAFHKVFLLFLVIGFGVLGVWAVVDALWSIYPELGMAAILVLTAPVAVVFVNALRNSRKRHLAFEAMLKAEREREGSDEEQMQS
jgi:hypothetical protein